MYWVRISFFNVTIILLDNFGILKANSLAIFTWNTAINTVFFYKYTWVYRKTPYKNTLLFLEDLEALPK